MFKSCQINFKAISRISSSIVILATVIVVNPFPSNSTLAEPTVSETKQTEYIPQVAFRKAPRLLDIYATFNAVRMRSARYYFDITIPEDAGAPLQKVEIELHKGQKKSTIG